MTDTQEVYPSVTFGYDVASRLITINNANATISRTYFNDNLLKSETKTTPPVEWPRTVTYGYDADGNRNSLVFPGYSFTYGYTGRNQLKNIVSGATTLATYEYDLNGNLTSCDLNNSTYSEYAYNELDRVTDITHWLNGGLNGKRAFAYGYESDSNNRKWQGRIMPGSPENNKGEVFDYDQADQVIGVQLNVLSPHTYGSIPQTIDYDANGNRTSFSAYGTTDTYTTNDLNQYTSRNTINATYDANGNLATGVDGSYYTYDAQNRLLSATKNGSTMSFAYDGLNRQVSRWIDNGQKTYSAWDGWNLVQEYEEDQGAAIVTASYLYGPTGLVKDLMTNNYYYQDGSGSTSLLADGSGALLEWYRYDLHGTPFFYDANNNQLSTTSYSVRHLFTGQQWYSELGLYDLRNRFYSPDIGRFLQPDPIDFAGDPTNLYRYVGNNPVTRRDPTGLNDSQTGGVLIKPLEAQQTLGSTAWWSGGRVWVSGNGFPSALEHSLGGEGLLGNSPSAHVGGLGGLGDWGGGGGGLFGNLPVNPFTPPNELPKNPFAPPLNPLPPTSFTQFTINIAIPLPRLGTLFGVQFNYSTTPYGQSFYAIGPQFGKALTGVSLSYTVNSVTSHYATGPTGMSQVLTGWSWSAGGGYYGGGLQWSGNLSPLQITSWGGGFFTTQGGVGVTYGWEAATPTP